MAGFPKSERQAIIDDYLSKTGRNFFVPGEFIDWLAGQEDHEAYPWFFSKDDTEAAREYRIGLARQMASGLRIVVRSAPSEKGDGVVSISVREYPAYVSPVSGRSSGGGYVRFDPDDADRVGELRRQGIVALKSWLNRYAGVFGDEAQAIYAIVEADAEEREAG